MLSRIVLFSGAAVFVAMAALAAGCGGTGSAAGKGDEIVAAFYPLAFAAEQITGGTTEVRNLTPAGAEPHDLELTPSDVRAVHDPRQQSERAIGEVVLLNQHLERAESVAVGVLGVRGVV